MALVIEGGISIGGNITITGVLTLTFTVDQIADILGTLGPNGMDPGGAVLLALTPEQQAQLTDYAATFGGSFSQVWTATWAVGSDQPHTYIDMMYGPDGYGLPPELAVLYVLDDVGNIFNGIWNFPVACAATPAIDITPPL